MKLDVDVTLAELKRLDTVKHLSPVFELLQRAWVEPFPKRETSVRIGSVETSVDPEGYVEIKFRSRCPMVNTSLTLK